MTWYFGAAHDLNTLIKTHLFIICPNNSGSTYLKRVLGTSNNTWNLPKEGQHVVGFAGPSSRQITNGKLWAIKRWRKVFTDPSAFNWSLTRKAWYFQAYSNDPKSSVFVEKSPPFLMNTHQLVGFFENTKFLIMVRNPYATVEGIRRRGKSTEYVRANKENILEQAANHVMNCFKYQRENIEKYSDISVFFTYEQMCDESLYVETLIKSLAPELDDFSIKQQIWVKDYNEMLRNMNDQQIARLSHEELEIINEVFDKHADLLNYFNYARVE